MVIFFKKNKKIRGPSGDILEVASCSRIWAAIDTTSKFLFA
jgi:head-tail adaptor